MIIPLSWYVMLSAALFTIGVVGVLSRRNIFIILMSMELMLNAANINWSPFPTTCSRSPARSS